MRARILLADDHDIVIDGYTSILSAVEGIEIVGKASNGIEVLEQLANTTVDLVILDLNMPKLDGAATARKIIELYPKVKILILTMFSDAVRIKELIEIGVNGYILKNSDKETLLVAINQIINGQVYYDAEVSKTILNKFKSSIEIEQDKVVLSERELEIIALIAKGNSTNEIAEKLFISPHTVKTHRKNINFKLGIHSPTELLHFAQKHHLI